MEHAVHNEDSRCIENKKLFLHNMVCFRLRLSTQNGIKMQIIGRATQDVRGLLTLDLAKALDTISHKFVQEAVKSTWLEPKLTAYVQAFFRDHEATIKIGGSTSTAFTVGAKNTLKER